jgi:medium-chain acyl-[acyl-carrier-protein] hydrolase
MASTRTNSNPWVACDEHESATKLRLFCFPYAGSGATIFQSWQGCLPHTIEVCPVNLPGRERRWHETPFTNLLSLVESLAPHLKPYLDKPFAFFGHSMGALMSFELARLLRKEKWPQPVHLFVSGNSAPQLESTVPPLYNLPEPDLVTELRRLNGTPKAVLDNPELRQLILPIIRADFEICQTYVYRDGPPLESPITALCGTQDEDVSPEALDAWRQQTASAFSLHRLEGDHFFLHAAQQQLLKIIYDELSRSSAFPL